MDISTGQLSWVKFGGKDPHLIDILGRYSFSFLFLSLFSFLLCFLSFFVSPTHIFHSAAGDDISAIRDQLKADEVCYFVLAKVCPDQSMEGAKDAESYNVIRNLFISWVGPEVRKSEKNIFHFR